MHGLQATSCASRRRHAEGGQVPPRAPDRAQRPQAGACMRRRAKHLPQYALLHGPVHVVQQHRRLVLQCRQSSGGRRNVQRPTDMCPSQHSKTLCRPLRQAGVSPGSPAARTPRSAALSELQSSCSPCDLLIRFMVVSSALSQAACPWQALPATVGRKARNPPAHMHVIVCLSASKVRLIC